MYRPYFKVFSVSLSFVQIRFSTTYTMNPTTRIYKYMYMLRYNICVLVCARERSVQILFGLSIDKNVIFTFGLKFYWLDSIASWYSKWLSWVRKFDLNVHFRYSNYYFISLNFFGTKYFCLLFLQIILQKVYKFYVIDIFCIIGFQFRKFGKKFKKFPEIWNES